MPRWAKVVTWAVVFTACAAAGAWLASRTDPFPPGVRDPGARPQPEPTATPKVERLPVWSGRIAATTEHRLHVGGTCRSDWLGSYRMRLLPDGTVGRSEGLLTLVPGTAGCDFDQAQRQTGSVMLDIVGTWRGGGSDVDIVIRFEERGLDPEGSIDVGGLLATIERVQPELRAEPGPPRDTLEGSVRVELGDGNQGTYVALYQVSAICRRGCGS
jgi:hypothetical protein